MPPQPKPQTFALAKIIDNFAFKNNLEKVFSLLDQLRSGKYHPHSNIRTFLIENYKLLILSLSDEEYKEFKQKFIPLIRQLIRERNQQKIAYSILSKIISYSCTKDFQVYIEYEEAVKELVRLSKDRFFYHLITAAQTRKNLLGDISELEEFFLTNYVALSPRKKIVKYRYVIDFTFNISGVNKEIIMRKLMAMRPFKNDFIVRDFISSHKELERYAALL